MTKKKFVPNPKHADEAADKGCSIEGRGKNRNYLKYKLPCSHVRECAISYIRNRQPACKVCPKVTPELKRNFKHISEAEAAGLVLIGRGRNSHYKKYKTPCCA